MRPDAERERRIRGPTRRRDRSETSGIPLMDDSKQSKNICSRRCQRKSVRSVSALSRAPLGSDTSISSAAISQSAQGLLYLKSPRSHVIIEAQRSAE